MFSHRILASRDLIVSVTRWSTETAAICLAVALFPTILAVGAVIDCSSANKYKAAIRVALDAALLAGGRGGRTDWTEIALNTFNAKLSSKYDRRPKPIFVQDPSTGNYIGSVSTWWPTSALGIINIGSIEVTATAAAIADHDNAFILNRDHLPPMSHVWSVNRSSGDAFFTTSAGQQIALSEGTILNRGNNIRTGPNGRVLLVRGKESILIASNSVIGLPTYAAEGMSTTIDQWAGSIVLAVEKRNHVHFEVETPYLAAVVRGTRFRVTVNKDAARVKVLRGQVEVTDFKSGQYALILPGQAAEASVQAVGLSLSGAGTLKPVRQGLPRSAPLHPMALSDRPLSAQNGTPNERQRQIPPTAENEWTPRSEDSRNSGLDVLARFFSRHVDQSNNANFYIVFAAGVLGTVVGAAANWLRHRRRQTSI